MAEVAIIAGDDRRLRFKLSGRSGGHLVLAAYTQIEDAVTGEILPYRRLTMHVVPEGWLKVTVWFASQNGRLPDIEAEVYLTDLSFEGIWTNEARPKPEADK
jgi:hypothetical protein